MSVLAAINSAMQHKWYCLQPFERFWVSPSCKMILHLSDSINPVISHISNEELIFVKFRRITRSLRDIYPGTQSSFTLGKKLTSLIFPSEQYRLFIEFWEFLHRPSCGGMLNVKHQFGVAYCCIKSTLNQFKHIYIYTRNIIGRVIHVL